MLSCFFNVNICLNWNLFHLSWVWILCQINKYWISLYEICHSFLISLIKHIDVRWTLGKIIFICTIQLLFKTLTSCIYAFIYAFFPFCLSAWEATLAVTIYRMYRIQTILLLEIAQWGWLRPIFSRFLKTWTDGIKVSLKRCSKRGYNALVKRLNASLRGWVWVCKYMGLALLSGVQIVLTFSNKSVSVCQYVEWGIM